MYRLDESFDALQIEFCAQHIQIICLNTHVMVSAQPPQIGTRSTECLRFFLCLLKKKGGVLSINSLRASFYHTSACFAFSSCSFCSRSRASFRSCWMHNKNLSQTILSDVLTSSFNLFCSAYFSSFFFLFCSFSSSKCLLIRGSRLCALASGS